VQQHDLRVIGSVPDRKDLDLKARPASLRDRVRIHDESAIRIREPALKGQRISIPAVAHSPNSEHRRKKIILEKRGIDPETVR
jgi:hypothetical protein